MKKCILFYIMLFLNSLFSFSQEVPIERWEGLFSYYQIKDIAKGNNKIYVAAENALFIYDSFTAEIETLSAIEGLSGEDITAIHYSENYSLLIVGYQNGLIEVVFDDTGEILSDVGIVDKVGIAPDEKRINNFFEKENTVYIATDFGISEFRLDFIEFGDTFFIGENADILRVNDVSIFNDIIYATTEFEIKKADFAAGDLINFNNWETLLTGSGWRDFIIADDNLFAAKNQNLYRMEDENFELKKGFSGFIRDFSFDNNILLITTITEVFALDMNLNTVQLFSSTDSLDLNTRNAEILEDEVYIGHQQLGLFKSSLSNPTGYESLSPNAPLLNNIFTMDVSMNQLWLGYGEYSVTYDPFPINNRGLSLLKDEQWINYSFEEILETPEIADIVINPFNPQEVYFASFYKGVLKFVDEEPIIRYDSTNSPLVEQEPSNEDNRNDVRVNELAFDREGNLWILDARNDNPLKILSPSGNFSEVNIASVIQNIAGVSGYSGLVIDRSGNAYFGTSEFGIVGYQPDTGNIAQFEIQSQDDSFLLNQVRAMALDQSGQLWVGTRSGLRVISAPAAIFTENQPQSRPIIIVQDGVPQELLFEQTITDIEVDGANNKWISTVSSGVFYFSSNGQETIYHFTKNNSPLPSDNVQEVAIDEETGTVYIGTDKGLLAFKGDVTGPKEDLENVFAYPNPVRPGFQGVVTIDGLTSAANVKITDVEGNLVFEQTTRGGSVQWDTTAFGNYKVASGVYLVLVTAEDQTETTVSKIMIIR